MSILIKGIGIPKLYKTYKVRFIEENNRIVIGMAIGDSLAYRPLGEVIIMPTPHGRLGDLDRLYKHIAAECNIYGKPTIGFEDGNKVLKIIENTRTVIEMEE